MLVFINQGECAVNYLHGKVQSVIVCETSFHWSSPSWSGVGVGVRVDSAGSKSESKPESLKKTIDSAALGLSHRNIRVELR